MSRANRNLTRKKLLDLLSRADDEGFLRLIWSINALQSGREKAASPYLAFPVEAATTGMTARYAIHDWELETLATILLTTPKYELRPGRNRVCDCGQFGTMATAINFLRRLENSESGIFLRNNSVLMELHRLAHRQFHWQHGYFNSIQLYRYAYLYGSGACGDFFLEKNQISLNEFSLVGFGLYHLFGERPYIARDISMEAVGVPPEKVEAALALLSIPLKSAREGSIQLKLKYGIGQPTGYQPSMLRQNPIISFGTNQERLLAPLPEMIMQRITSGVFYDLQGASGSIRNDAAARFEDYCRLFAQKTLSTINVRKSHKYKFKGNLIDAPDLLFEMGGVIRAIVECKARKLTFSAQYADDPVARAGDEYAEISEGIKQIWRYFAHVRLGITQAELDEKAIGVVLTLDPWLLMSGELIAHVQKEACKLAANVPEIADCDKRHVIFCSVEEFERTVLVATDQEFLDTILVAIKAEYQGWALSNIFESIFGKDKPKKAFPFNLSDVLPWHGMIEDLAKTRNKSVMA